MTFRLPHFWGLRGGVPAVYCWFADKTGMGRSRWSAQTLMRSRPAGQGGPGTAGIVCRPAGSRQPFGSSRPRSFRALPGGQAELAVDLAGDITLEAADDLRLGLAFGRAALSVGAGGRVRAQAGEHDPPQGVVRLAVAAVPLLRLRNELSRVSGHGIDFAAGRLQVNSTGAPQLTAQARPFRCVFAVLL